MSLEQLVIALIILLPLLDGVMRLLRERTRRRQGSQPDRDSGQPSTRRPSSMVSEPDVDGASIVIEAADIPPPPPVPSWSPPSQKRGGGDAVGRRIGPARDLRRGIVLTTILGSCRAMEPNDAPHRPS